MFSKRSIELYVYGCSVRYFYVFWWSILFYTIIFREPVTSLAFQVNRELIVFAEAKAGALKADRPAKRVG